MEGTIVKLDYKEAIDFLLPKHYSGRIPNITFAYGWIVEEKLVAVCTFGKPVSPYLCNEICGMEWSKNVYELNRLCRVEKLDHQISQFVSACLRDLSNKNLIIVSYSDTAMNHHGYIYQATNFLYTGKTKERTDKYVDGNKHPRHYDNDQQNGLRRVRSAKYRYVYFATKNKKLKKLWNESLKYDKLPYPKGDNENYVLGEYLQPKLVADTKNMLDNKN